MDAVSEVKGRLNIEDVVGEYVRLKRSGRNYKGLSPWTNERTPSFMVSPEKQIWHDFSSGKGGDVFGFVMEVEGLDFKGALEFLARKAGVDLDEYQPTRGSGNSKLKARAHEALELAAKFYQKQLTVNKPAVEYLINKRKFSKKTILEWQLGYSPNKGVALFDFLGKKGFSVEEIKRAGLSTTTRLGNRDMFRGRIMIPLCDASGAVVGFTARLLADEPNAPKYINTPATLVYDKSRQIFGLHLAKEAIRKSAVAIVVEGNMDVIASHQAGISNVVASAGTAMTEQHLRALKRFTGDIRLSFDADKAGIAATERIIPLAQKAEVDLKIITISGAKDPDELIQKSPKAWQESIDKAASAPDWLIERYQQAVNLNTAEGKRVFTDALLGTVRALRDPIEQEHYLKRIAQLTDTSLEAVKAKFVGQRPDEAPLKRPKTSQSIDMSDVESQKMQDHFLAMLLLVPALRDLLSGMQTEYFTDGPPHVLLNFLKNNPTFKGEAKTAAGLKDTGDYVKIITLQFEELYADLPLEDLKEQATNLKHRIISRYITTEKARLAQAMRDAKNENELTTLVKKVDKLNALLTKS